MWRSRKVPTGIGAKADSDNSWSIDIKDVDSTNFDLSVKNPNKGGEVALREPREILKEMGKLGKESDKILKSIINLI